MFRLAIAALFLITGCLFFRALPPHSGCALSATDRPVAAESRAGNVAAGLAVNSPTVPIVSNRILLTPSPTTVVPSSLSHGKDEPHNSARTMERRPANSNTSSAGPENDERGEISRQHPQASNHSSPDVKPTTRLKRRLHEFVRRISNLPIPAEVIGRLHRHSLRFPYPQQPCVAYDHTAAALPRDEEAFRTLLAADDLTVFLGDMHSTVLSSQLRQTLIFGSQRGGAVKGTELLFSNMSRCAVVGSAPRILEKTDGALIDSHDVVFRVNLSPLRPYCRHVGTKRTVEVANANILSSRWTRYVQDTETVEDAFGKQRTVPRFGPFGLVPGITGQDYQTNFLPARYQQVIPGSRFVFMSPDVRRLANRLYCHMSSNGTVWPHGNKANAGNGIAPTSGFMAVIFALSTCHEVSVFGFGQSSDHGDWYPRRASAAHFFDQPAVLSDDGDYGGHWFTLERYLLHRMVQEGLITWN
eukprot:TRINITY_DN10332_c0_g2_i1.p1 TRINITY_DN10332_c0_g2~~TRINITY_DN10332_c0_g2_i1.p1  ORF type:complete len:471 (+),score=53.77 TRINITY_DN10332_c0_g2_i1:95-1507(+)